MNFRKVLKIEKDFVYKYRISSGAYISFDFKKDNDYSVVHSNVDRYSIYKSINDELEDYSFSLTLKEYNIFIADLRRINIENILE